MEGTESIKNMLNNTGFIAWIMHTPNEKIPENTMYLPKYTELGQTILCMIDNNELNIAGMDSNGILLFDK